MAIFGGKNKADWFRMAVNLAKTAYEFFQVDGATAATAYTDRGLRLNETVVTSLPVDDSGILNTTWDQDKDDGEWLAWTDATAKPPSGGSKVGQRNYEDGQTKFGDAGASSVITAGIIYGADGEVGSDVEGNVLVTGQIGKFPPSNRSRTQSASATSAPPAKCNGMLAEFEVDLTPFLDPNIVTVTTEELKIPAGESCFVKWLPKAGVTPPEEE